MPEPTLSRVPRHTDTAVNREIRLMTECNVARFMGASEQDIDERLKGLEREWDIERTLETNASAISLAGLTLGMTVSKKWFILPAVVAGFLLQHALQGWCPPVPLFRRLGIRTAAEIDAERYALKVLRGDFREACGNTITAPELVHAAGR